MHIGSMRLLDIRVIKNDSDTLYDGMVDSTPAEIKELVYSKTEMLAKFVSSLFTNYQSLSI